MSYDEDVDKPDGTGKEYDPFSDYPDYWYYGYGYDYYYNSGRKKRSTEGCYATVRTVFYFVA